MLIAHRIALDPNNVQATCFARAAGTARFAYMRQSSRFAGKIMSATISRVAVVADRWFVSIAVDAVDDSPLPKAQSLKPRRGRRGFGCLGTGDALD